MVKPWPKEIDGLPNLKMVDLSMAMLVITRWYIIIYDFICRTIEKHFFPTLNHDIPQFDVHLGKKNRA